MAKAKQVTGQAKFQVTGGQATPAPPVGTSLGKFGINLGQFVQQFNERTKEFTGTPIPVIVTVYSDRSFDFVTKMPPASALLKMAAGIASGSGVPNKVKVAKVTSAQIVVVATSGALADDVPARQRVDDVAVGDETAERSDVLVALHVGEHGIAAADDAARKDQVGERRMRALVTRCVDHARRRDAAVGDGRLRDGLHQLGAEPAAHRRCGHQRAEHRTRPLEGGRGRVRLEGGRVLPLVEDGDVGVAFGGRRWRVACS